ncbi:MAG: ABC transporter permease [Cyanobacteria bacterium]|nr:ABC transporter permease [Cyanobacteriota bacterium]
MTEPAAEDGIVTGKIGLGPGTILRGLLQDKVTLLACFFLAILAIVAVCAPWITPHDPMDQNLFMRHKPPMSSSDSGLAHILGTDALGRDLLSRLMMGAQVSLSIGLLGVLVSGTLGVTLGLISGYYRGWLDDIIMRTVDVMLGFPTLLVALFVLFVIGGGYVNLVLVLALTRWMIYARVARGMTLSLREEPFIEGARVIGASDFRIITRHLWPNLFSPVLVLATLEVARLILAESALSFLGFGIQPPSSSWGLEVAGGRSYITTAWWIVTFSGAIIFLTALSLNLIANWLRALADPVQRWRWLSGQTNTLNNPLKNGNDTGTRNTD